MMRIVQQDEMSTVVEYTMHIDRSSDNDNATCPSLFVYRQRP